jgi:hypothetical protein
MRLRQYFVFAFGMLAVVSTLGNAALPPGGGIPGRDRYDWPAPIPLEKLAISSGDVEMHSGSYKFETVEWESDTGLTLVRSLSSEALGYVDGYKHFEEFSSHN